MAKSDADKVMMALEILKSISTNTTELIGHIEILKYSVLTCASSQGIKKMVKQ